VVKNILISAAKLELRATLGVFDKCGKKRVSLFAGLSKN
jgi:hypothetical protein